MMQIIVKGMIPEKADERQIVPFPVHKVHIPGDRHKYRQLLKLSMVKTYPSHGFEVRVAEEGFLCTSRSRRALIYEILD
jgi:hypothetical protein